MRVRVRVRLRLRLRVRVYLYKTREHLRRLSVRRRRLFRVRSPDRQNGLRLSVSQARPEDTTRHCTLFHRMSMPWPLSPNLSLNLNSNCPLPPSHRTDGSGSPRGCPRPDGSGEQTVLDQRTDGSGSPRGHPQLASCTWHRASLETAYGTHD